MDPHQIKQHLTDLVLDGREELAIEELIAMSNSSSKDVRKSVTTLSNIFRKFERDKSNGHLNPEKINFTSDRISQALLVIIEQITEEDEANRKEIDLDTLFHDIEESSAGGSKLLKRRALMMNFAIVIPIGIVAAVGILTFNGTFSRTTNPGEAALNGWIGEWQHQMESQGNKEITGSIKFEVASEDQLVGKSYNTFPDGSQTTNTLSRIQFSHKGKVMEGVWQTENIQSLHGTFRLNLDEENRFAGHYTVVNQEGEFYWNGMKQ